MLPILRRVSAYAWASCFWNVLMTITAGRNAASTTRVSFHE